MTRYKKISKNLETNNGKMSGKTKSYDYLIFSPLIIFFLSPLLHDVIPYGTRYTSEDWLAVLIVYSIGLLISVHPFIILMSTFNAIRHAKEQFSHKNRRSLLIRTFINVAILIATIVFFWLMDDARYFYISLPITLVVSVIVCNIGLTIEGDTTGFHVNKNVGILRDSETGKLYHVNGKRLNAIPGDISEQYQRRIDVGAIAAITFSSAAIAGFDAHADSIAFSPVDIPGMDIHSGPIVTPSAFESMSINPANGMPMLNDNIDVAGNVWGTTSDPFPSHDYSSGIDSFSHSTSSFEHD